MRGNSTRIHVGVGVARSAEKMTHNDKMVFTSIVQLYGVHVPLSCAVGALAD
jgi:hypothetical protein